MSARKAIISQQLKPSAFIAQHANFIASQATGPIADLACGSGRNLVPFINLGQRIDCYDIQPNCVDPKITEAFGRNLRFYHVDLMAPVLALPHAKYSVALLVHFYNAKVISRIVQAIQPRAILVLETVDDRGGNYHELPFLGDVFHLAGFLKILNCAAKPAGLKSDRQVVKLIAQRL